MSGPVSPPLATTESGTTVRVQPTNTLEFNGADFTVTQSGSKASISIDSTGTGAALTATQVGFGDSSNLLTGSTKFTWNDTAGSEQLKIIGSGVTDGGLVIENTNTGVTSAPDLVLHRNVTGTDNDFIGRMDFRGQDDTGNDVNYLMMTMKIQDASEDAGRLGFFVSGNASLNADDSQLMIFGRSGLSGNPGLVSINNSARSDVDFRVSGDTNANLIRTDASLDAVGIGVAPPSSHAGITVRMTVKGDNDDIALMLQNEGTDADDGPEMVFYRNSSSPAADDLLGRIRFDGEDSGDNIHTYFRMTNAIKDPTDASEDGRFLFESRSGGSLIEVMRFEGDDIDINANNVATVDVKIRGDNDTILFSDASQDNLGLGTSTPASDVERLHVKGTGADVLVRLESTEGGATAAPDLELFRNSASPASGDFSGQIQFTGYEDTGASSKVTYGEIDVRMFGLDGTESGNMVLKTRQNNANRPQISMNQVGVTINENHEAPFDFVVESDESAAGFHNIYADSGQNNVGLGCVPDSDVERLHLKGSGATDPMMRIESTDADASHGPIIDFFRNSDSPADNDLLGKIAFSGNDSGGAKHEYAQIRTILRDTGAGSEDGAVIFEAVQFSTEAFEFLRYGLNAAQSAREVVVNENGSSVIAFRVEGDTNANLISTSASQDNVGIGAAPSSTGAQFQVSQGAQFFRETSNTFTANHDITVEQAHGHVLVMDASSGSANTFTLPDVPAVGMHVKLVNLAGSNGMTVAVAGSTTDQINGAGTAGSSSVSTTTKFQTIECHYVATNVWVATEPAVAA